MVSQTKRSFAEKWENSPTLMFGAEYMKKTGVLNWILQRNGFDDLHKLAKFLASKGEILDAGCGNGRITNLFSSLTNNPITAIDFNISIAHKNLRDAKNVKVVEKDLMKDLSDLGKFDFIYCQEVLHHTKNPKLGVKNLSKILRANGILAIYVYRKKSPIREFTDDFIRSKISRLNYKESFAIAQSITTLGKALQEHKNEISVPEIEILGIKAGSYTVQELVYNYFLKCWHNSGVDFAQSVAINLDWFHPEICSRHELSEVRRWFSNLDLMIIHEVEDAYGITVHAKKI